MKLSTLAAALALTPTMAVAAPPGQRIEDISLEDLLETESSVATTVPLSTRELPAVVSVIRGDDLRRSGVRDLLEAIQQVPGFQAGLDVQGTIGLAFRGQWAADGRLLVLVDGQPLNEPLYGTSPLGARIPVDAIERIEVLRGPGVSHYGGTAAAAVINVITRAAEAPHGSALTGNLCLRPGGIVCGSLVGHTVVEQGRTRVGIGAHAGRDWLSSGPFKDVYDGSIDGPTAQVVPLRASLDVRHGDLALQAGLEAWQLSQQDGVDEVLEEALPNHFQSAWLRGSWMHRASSRWTVAPSLEMGIYRPWSSENQVPVENYAYYDRTLQRVRTEIGAVGEVSPELQLDLGVGGQLDWLRSSERWEQWPLPSGRRDMFGGSTWARSDLLWARPTFNLMMGLRVDWQTPTTPALKPRIAFTTAGAVWHMKLLVLSSTYTPPYEALASNDQLSNVGGASVEVEVGARPIAGLHIRANAFANQSLNPLTYAVIDDEDVYVNGEPISTAGLEAEVSYDAQALDIDANYALNVPILNGDPYYAAPGHPRRRAALATHTANLTVRWNPAGHLWLGPRVRLIGPRTVWTGLDESGEASVATDLPAAAVVDATVRLEGLANQRLDLTLTARDLLGQDPGWAQPFDGWHAPMSGRGRELSLSVSVRR